MTVLDADISTDDRNAIEYQDLVGVNVVYLADRDPYQGPVCGLRGADEVTIDDAVKGRVTVPFNEVIFATAEDELEAYRGAIARILAEDVGDGELVEAISFIESDDDAEHFVRHVADGWNTPRRDISAAMMGVATFKNGSYRWINGEVPALSPRDAKIPDRGTLNAEARRD